MSLSAGAKLGPYEILSPLGAGGMGEVYRARDPRLGRDVAVKVVRLAAADSPPDGGARQDRHVQSPLHSGSERLRRFEQEARAAGTLNHPNILAVYDTGTQDGAPYIVTELLEGETLRERLQRDASLGHHGGKQSISPPGSGVARQSGGLPCRKALDYSIQLATGLAAAH